MKSFKKIALSCILLSTVLPGIANANCHYGESALSAAEGPYFGPVVCGVGEIGSLTVFGPVKTEGTSITGDVKVMGAFSAKNTSIAGKFVVFGALKAFDLTLQQNAIVATDYALLNHSNLRTFQIKSDSAADLYLENNSVITGDLKFDSKQRGRVHLQPGSVISGQIINGDVVL